ncbi:MAG TPA: hypothetical protein VMT90_08820 [Dehalococcoidia bacterium]|nr:hypothetical protein [Dehalococcoidia bacterium]
MRPGGVVFLDDYQLPAIARAASFFLTNLGWMLEEVSRADALHQWAVLRTSSVPDTRPFDYYVSFQAGNLAFLTALLPASHRPLTRARVPGGMMSTDKRSVCTPSR